SRARSCNICPPFPLVQSVVAGRGTALMKSLFSAPAFRCLKSPRIASRHYDPRFRGSLTRTSTRLEWRHHSVGPFHGTFVACLLPQQFLRHEHISYGHFPINFREEWRARLFGQVGAPVCFLTIPLYLADGIQTFIPRESP